MMHSINRIVTVLGRIQNQKMGGGGGEGGGGESILDRRDIEVYAPNSKKAGSFTLICFQI